mgnify:CR=1 FL=1
MTVRYDVIGDIDSIAAFAAAHHAECASVCRSVCSSASGSVSGKARTAAVESISFEAGRKTVKETEDES